MILVLRGLSATSPHPKLLTQPAWLCLACVTLHCHLRFKFSDFCVWPNAPRPVLGTVVLGWEQSHGVGWVCT